MNPNLGPQSRPNLSVVSSNQGALSGGGDGPYNGDMEARIRHLETDMSEVKTDMKDVRDRLARIEGEVRRLPGYPGIATIVALVGSGLLIASKLLPNLPPAP